jgi:nicotinate phosphoribosyltransferase
MPTNFLVLVDTYDTLSSGVPNYVCVALALQDAGFQPKGIRLDSGDLA